MRVAVLLGFLLVAAMPRSAHAQPAGGFQHIIIIVQENRTPDNLFGSNPNFEPGVDIARAGMNSAGETFMLRPVALAGCYDIDHSHRAFVEMFAQGKMNGADQEGTRGPPGCVVPRNPQFKFVDNSAGDVQPYFDIAKYYGFASRMFQTQQGPSLPAHQFLFGGTSAVTVTSHNMVAENTKANKLGDGCTASSAQRVVVIDAMGVERKPGVYPCYDRATIANLLDQGSISWRYYTNVDDHLNALSYWNAPSAISKICMANRQGPGGKCVGAEYVKHVSTAQAAILTDIQDCDLRAVSWVVPDAADSDHAGVNAGTGPSWVAAIVNAVGTQPSCAGGEPYWKNTAILITWDDWGGWYDHVPPFKPHGQPDGWGAGNTYGFRVPLLVVSAYTASHTVDANNHDFGSTLAFVEDNFRLGRIGPGKYADFYADNLSGFFNLASPRGFVPIPAKIPAQYFLAATRSAVGPDDD